VACDHLLPPWTPHAICLWLDYKKAAYHVWSLHGFLGFERLWLLSAVLVGVESVRGATHRGDGGRLRRAPLPVLGLERAVVVVLAFALKEWRYKLEICFV
jgi:hypothetical protein